MSEIIVGRNPVLSSLRSGHPINRLLIAKNAVGHPPISEILDLARSQKIPFQLVERSVLDRMNSKNQGVIALAAAHRYFEVENLLKQASDRHEKPLLVMLDGMEDPQNLGAILRSSEAAGAHVVIIRQRREVPLTGAVAKASAGAIEYIKVARVTNLTSTIKDLKEQGLWVIGVEAGGQKNFWETDFKGPVVIVIGSEGKGISRLVKENCDFLVSIPMLGRVPSLNASVAAGIILYEVVRQRNR